MLIYCHCPIIRSIKRHRFTPTSTLSSFSGNEQEHFAIANEVVALINSRNPIRPVLSKFAPILNREMVISVLQSQARLKKDPRICFRFFIWSAEKSRFRSGVSHRLIVDMLLSGGVSNSFDLYWSVLDELRNEKIPIPADAFAVLILGYWRLRKAEKAVETFDKMKEYECEPNLAAYNVILNVLVKKREIFLAMAIYYKLMKSNWRIGCDTYNVLLDGLCKSGKSDLAEKLFDEMIERGILPNRITYTVIVSMLCKEKRTDEAYRIYVRMKNSGCKPDAAICNALLAGFCKCGEIDEALRHFESFTSEGYDIGLKGYSSLVDGLIRAKRFSEAGELIHKVFHAGLAPDVVLYTILLRGLCELGRLKEAIGILRYMIQEGVIPDTQCYNVLIKGLCDTGLLNEAQSLKLEVSRNDKFPTTYTCTILICGLCRNGMLQDAQQIFKDMEKLGCSPSVVTFNALIDGLCKAGNLEEAVQMRHEMDIRKSPLFLRLSQGTSLQEMVENLVDSGEVLEAYQFLQQLADRSDAVPDIVTYNSVINGLCKEGKIEDALNLFKELQVKGHVPDAITYSTLINGFQIVGREGDAFRLIEDMKNRCKPTPSVYKTIMTWSCRRSKTSVAFIIWLRYLRSLGGRDEEALKLPEEYFQKGDLVEAVRSLLELDVKLPDFDSSPCNIWLIGLCQVKRVEDALKTFSLLVDFNVNVYAPACIKLIYALRAEENLDKAVDVFLYCMEKGYQLKSGICNTILQRLLHSKDKATVAFELLDRMQSVGYNLDSLLYIRTKSLIDKSLWMQNEQKAVG